MEIKRVSTRGSAGGTWFDAMLGQGSARTVNSAVGRFRREAAPNAYVAPQRTMRMRAVGSGSEEEVQVKSKGYFRLGLAGLALVFVAARFKPWQSLESMKLSQLIKVQEPAAAATPQATPVTPAATEVASNLPLVDAGGTAVALWRSETGGWYGVNSKAELSKMLEADAAVKLNLPQLSGAAAHLEEKHGGRVIQLQLDPQQLAELLPLREDLAGDVDLVIVKGRDFSLRTSGAGLADLGEDDFKRKQARLAAVLADLGARKKRAASVDLRFENTAVVRLAAR